MRKIITFITAFSLLISSGSAFAVNIIENTPETTADMTVTPGSGKCGENVNWELSSDGTLTISGSGEMYTYAESDKLPWFEKNDSQAILNIVIEDGVESVCSGAFSKTSIVALTLPDSVKEVGEYAISSCSNLEYVSLSDNIEVLPVGALYYNRAMTYVHMPKSLKVIGNSAFAWCDKLEELVLPVGVTEIAEKAFADCFALKKIVIPPGVTTLENAVFRQDYSLTELYLPPSLKTIGDTAVPGCPNIDKIILPDGITEIGMSAFDWADEKRTSSSKQIIYIPKSVTSFGKWAVLGDIEIHGFSGSAAETYAKENKIPFVAVTESMYSETDYNRALNGQAEVPPEIPVQKLKAPTTESQANILDVVNSNNALLIKMNGVSISFDEAEPFIDENGRTQIPVRSVAEAMNCKVDWDETARKVTLTKDSKTVVITIGSAELSVDGKAVMMDTTAQIKNDSTYIPLRFVGEALGITVNWVN